MRYFLGVHKFAPNFGVQGDMGWMLPKYRRFLAMIRFWNRMVHLDNNRLVKCVFNYDYDQNKLWSTNIRNIAVQTRMAHVYENKSSFDISAIKAN